MMITLPAPPPDPYSNATMLTSPGVDKNTHSRLRQFAVWLEAGAKQWITPDLAAYRDHLLYERGLQPTSVDAHLGTIRAHYRHVILPQREAFYALLPRIFDARAAAMSISDKKAAVDEIVLRLERAIDPRHSRVSITRHQDEGDSDHLRLTVAQAQALLAQPDLSTNKGLRDTAIIALMLATGLREGEVVALQVGDLRQRLGGELALRVRHGKGNKARLIPYGGEVWALWAVERWLERLQDICLRAGLPFTEKTPVFIALARGGNSPTGLNQSGGLALTTRGLQKILASYPVEIEGAPTPVKAHDLRRTYARRQFEAGMALEALRQNLGHDDLRTTLGYIGRLDGEWRRGRTVFAPRPPQG